MATEKAGRGIRAFIKILRALPELVGARLVG